MHHDEEPLDQEDINLLLRELDHPRLPVPVAAIIARAQQEKPRWGRWAAAILLVAGLGGVAYAIPGSPVPRWVSAAVGRFAGSPSPPRSPDSVITAPDAAIAGIAMEPGADFRIVFSHLADGGVARVTLADGTDVIVRAPGGAATFTSDVNRLVIDNQPSTAMFDIVIPRSALRVEIQVAGHRIFLKDHDRVEAGTATISHQQYLLPLKP
jgi:hypothetical protein